MRRWPMDEQEYLTSTDPAALLACCRNRLTEGQLLAWDRACGEVWFPAQPGATCRPGYRWFPEDAYAEAATWTRATIPEETPAVMADRCRLLRCIAGNPFRRVQLIEWCENPEDFGIVPFSPDWLTPTAVALARAIRDGSERECSKCWGNRGCTPGDEPFGFCPHCHGTGTVRDPRWEDMPVLADLLEQEGCPEGIGVLEHLRNLVPCPINYGKGHHRSPEWASTIDWACKECAGTEWLPGPLPALHCAECWVLRLILGDAP